MTGPGNSAQCSVIILREKNLNENGRVYRCGCIALLYSSTTTLSINYTFIKNFLKNDKKKKKTWLLDLFLTSLIAAEEESP